MNNAVGKEGGKYFANNWFVDDERNGTTGMVVMFENGVCQSIDVFEPMDFIGMLVEGFNFVLAGFVEGEGKHINQPITNAMKVDFLDGGFDEIWVGGL